MTLRYKTLFRALAFAGLGFAYGFLCNHYRLFPYYELADLKTWASGGFDDPPPVYEASSPTAVEVMETALQRLLVKRVPLPNGAVDFNGGGAITRVENVLYAVTGYGRVLAFDLSARSQLDATVDTVPMRRPELLRSQLRYTVRLPWFRVSGAYGEANADGSHTLFVAHNVYDPERECITANVSRAELSTADGHIAAPDGWRTIFTSDPCLYPEDDLEGPGVYPFSGHISGGSILPFDDSRMLVSIGDYTYDGFVRPAYASDLSNPYGKILLMDRETGQYEIYSYGNRNPMGLYRDLDGTVWSTEIGPQEGDELNKIVRGTNYGWPEVTYGINYDTTPWPLSAAQGRHDEYQLPVLAWVPGIAPTNLVRIEGDSGRFEMWAGDLVLGSLKDQSLRRVRLAEGDRAVFDERIPIGDRIRDIVRLEDGTLILLADRSGRLIFLGDGGPVFEAIDDEVLARIMDLELYQGLADETAYEASLVVDGEVVFTQRCSSCHAVEGRSLWGPPLGGLLGREVGSVDDFEYSFELESDSRSWSPELLRSFLLDPAEVFSNSRMPAVPISEAHVDSVVAYIGRTGG